MKSSKLIDSLAIVDENILAEAAQQPLLFIAAVRYRVRKMRLKAQAEAALEQHDSGLDLRIRARGNKRGEKYTEGTIKATIRTNGPHKELQALYDQAAAEEEFAKGLLEAYRMRRDAIRVLAEAQQYEGIKDTAELDRIREQRKISAQARKLVAERQRHQIDD